MKIDNDPIHGCVILTNDNVDRIVEVAALRGFTIDYLRDNMECHAEFSDHTVLFTSIYPWARAISNFNDVGVNKSDDLGDVQLMTTDEFIELLEVMPAQS